MSTETTTEYLRRRDAQGRSRKPTSLYEDCLAAAQGDALQARQLWLIHVAMGTFLFGSPIACAGIFVVDAIVNGVK